MGKGIRRRSPDGLHDFRPVVALRVKREALEVDHGGMVRHLLRLQPLRVHWRRGLPSLWIQRRGF